MTSKTNGGNSLYLRITSAFFSILSWPLLLFPCSFTATTTRTSLKKNIHCSDARTHASLHRNSHFFASVRERNVKRLKKTFYYFFYILFRSTVCFLQFLLFFSSITTTTTTQRRYYYHQKRQQLVFVIS